MISESSHQQMRRESIPESLRQDLGDFFVSIASGIIPVLVSRPYDQGAGIIFANDDFLSLLKTDADSVLDHSIQEIFSTYFDRASLKSLLRALADGQTGSWEMQCRTSANDVFLATVYASPVRNHRGLTTHNFVSIVKLEGHVERLLEGRDELHTIYENAPVFIATAEGPDHRFTFANAAYKNFVGCSDLVKRTVAEALPQIASQGFIEVLDEVFATGVPFVGQDIEFVMEQGDVAAPEVKFCDFVYQPVYAADGSITGIFCSGYDVTERHISALKLAALQGEVTQLSRVNAMGTMAATLAHELNQPMAALLNYAEAGKRHLSKDSKENTRAALRALEAISELARRTGNLVGNLRDLTAEKQGQEEQFELTKALAECIDLVAAASAGHVQIVDRSEPAILVKANRIQVQQVVINLLKNACEAAAETGQRLVELCAVPSQNSIKVSVTDSGPGVSEQVANTLFTLNNSTKPDGMGIGLSVSRTIVEGHGGRIWLEDTSAMGSQFCFTLPALASADG